MFTRLTISVAAFLGLAFAGSMRADTLALSSPGGYTNVVTNYNGEAFTVSGTGNYSSIAFAFLTPASSPFAAGTGFLLSQAYTGTVGALSSSTAGYLGSTAAIGNEYSFGSSVQLSAGNNYYFYENALITSGTLGGGPTSTPFPQNYYVGTGGDFTAQPGTTLSFEVTGSPSMATSVTPEPSSMVLLGTGLLSVMGAVRKRFQ